jgi:cobalt transporter subunit CbtA
VLWGGAGFLAFGLAPALGLPPELPGAPAADLASRQTWWLLAAGCTASGLALMAFARQPILRLAGVAALVIPHAIGAPHADGVAGSVPAELAGRFAVASLFAAAVFWGVLGGLSGYLFQRFDRA